MLALALVPAAAAAGALPTPAVDPASRITLALRTPFDDVPPPGACTVELTIRNDSRRNGVWDVVIQSQEGLSALRSRHSLAVEAGASRTFLLVGLNSSNASWRMSTVAVRGPGVGSDPVHVCQRAWVSSPSGRTLNRDSVPFAMSRSLGDGMWDALGQALMGHSSSMAGGRFEPAELPGDVRSYSGLALIYMRQEEWAALAAGVKEAIEDWASLGGHLRLVGPPAPDRRMGFGRVSTSSLPPSGAMDPAQVAQEVLAEGGTEFVADEGQPYQPWSLPAELPEPETSRGSLFAFLLVVAFLLGPLNLFWFARGRRRHRVYWTTPLLSAAAALALGAYIFLKDGTGGTGLRWTAVAIRPDAHRAAVMQEQVSRTGVLLGGVFRSPDPLRVVPLNLDAGWVPGMSLTRRETSGDAYSGWFRSRAREAHYLESLRPTRGRLEVTRGAAPQALSTIDGVLEDLYVVDERGAVWHAAAVRAGQRAALARAEGFDGWFDGVMSGAGPAGRRRLDRMRKLAGYFYATSREGGAIETLPSIRWTQKRLLYVGPAEVVR